MTRRATHTSSRGPSPTSFWWRELDDTDSRSATEERPPRPYSGLPSSDKSSRFGGKKEEPAMIKRAGSGVDSTASSKPREYLASALRTQEDLLLVVESASLSRAHSKSTTDSPARPELSGPAAARARRLAARLASSD